MLGVSEGRSDWPAWVKCPRTGQGSVAIWPELCSTGEEWGPETQAGVLRGVTVHALCLVTSHRSLLPSFPCTHGQTGERPANLALWWVNGQGDEVKWSFGELGSLSRKAANVLTKPCGLRRGDRVAVILPRIPEWWLVNVACMRTGRCQR